ncbi:MAG: hypothetical protein J5517_05040 [Eubacterium sp.]|nr:hypothetical protein [Eubacterium sp.]
MKGLDIKAVLSAFIFSMGGAYVFYNRIYGLLPAMMIGVYSYRVIHKNSLEKEKLKRLGELKSMMISFQSSLAAGKSMESSVHLALKDLTGMYSKKSIVVRSLEKVEGKLKLKYSLDQCLKEFAEEIDIREAEDFATVLSTIRRTGGNAVKIIRDTVERIVSEIELREEIATMVAAKRMELMIMVFMPSAISVFLRLSNKGFLDPLFGKPAGIGIMTVLMIANLGADYLGRKIVDIY